MAVIVLQDYTTASFLETPAGFKSKKSDLIGVRGHPSGIPLPTVYILLSIRFAYILICYCLATALF